MEKANPIYIKLRRNEGATLQEIGDEVGRSRERIRQLLLKHYGTTATSESEGLLTTKELVAKTGYSETSISKLTGRSLIKPAGRGKGGTYLWSPDDWYAIRRKCRICGKPLPKGKISYCSLECAKIGRYEMVKRAQWRRFYRMQHKPLVSSIQLIRKRKGKDCDGED